MTTTSETIGATTVLRLSAVGAPLSGVAEFTDLIGEAMGADCELVVIPVTRLTGEFFRLRSGLAGEVTQKFTNYRIRLAILGDIGAHTEQSTALTAFVAESNRGGQLWFLPDEAALAARLG
jgi:hypothetical protein